MMIDFRGVSSSINGIKEQLDSIQKTLMNTYESVVEIKEMLSDENNWVGESQLVGTAFFDLVIQYHEMLVGQQDGNGPIQQASDAFEEYKNNNIEFYGNWNEYQEIKKM